MREGLTLLTFAFYYFVLAIAAPNPVELFTGQPEPNTFSAVMIVISLLFSLSGSFVLFWNLLSEEREEVIEYGKETERIKDHNNEYTPQGAGIGAGNSYILGEIRESEGSI